MYASSYVCYGTCIFPNTRFYTIVFIHSIGHLTVKLCALVYCILRIMCFIFKTLLAFIRSHQSSLKPFSCTSHYITTHYYTLHLTVWIHLTVRIYLHYYRCTCMLLHFSVNEETVYCYMYM